MNNLRCACTVLFVLLLAPRIAVAEDKLSCQADLRLPDCTKPGEVWTSSGPLHVGVTCQECSVKGSEVSCSPAEKATAANLSIETPLAKVVEGAFADVGGCGMGIKLFQFGGSLTAGESYVLVITVPPHERTALLNFRVGSDVVGGDGSTLVTPGDAQPGSDLSGLSTEAGLPLSPDNDTSGQEGDSGCSCRTVADPHLSFVFFLAILLLPMAVIRRHRLLLRKTDAPSTVSRE